MEHCCPPQWYYSQQLARELLGFPQWTVMSSTDGESFFLSLSLSFKRWCPFRLPRLVLNSWAPVIFLPQPPKELGLQAHTIAPGCSAHFFTVLSAMLQ
jgi:hypothetical protein